MNKNNFKDISVGDVIKLTHIYKFDVLRDNDRLHSKVGEIFTDRDSGFTHVVKITKGYVILANYDGQSIPNDNFYVIKMYNGVFTVVKNHVENTKRCAIYYKEDYFGYVGEDEDYVYLAHYSVYCDGIGAMRKVKKKEYYKYAISLYDFDYAKQCYNKEWGLVGELLA